MTPVPSAAAPSRSLFWPSPHTSFCRTPFLGPDQSSTCSTRSLAGKHRPSVHRRMSLSIHPRAAQRPRGPAVSDDEAKDVDIGLKAAWMGAEAVGNMMGAAKGSDSQSSSNEQGQQPIAAAGGRLTREEAFESIKKDYDTNYFISGKGDLAAYAPDCRFADPFAAFRGVDRFKRNVSNLGRMLSDVDLKITSWEEDGNNLRTKWRFSAVLDLPWRPLLAAAGSTVHVFDPETGLVSEHQESWDTEPIKVLERLLKPNAKVPTNQWEVFMNAVSEGDPKGMWLATSGLFGKGAAALLAASLVLRVATGEGLPGSWLLVVLFLGAGITEVLKIATGMQGGETGTGGRF